MCIHRHAAVQRHIHTAQSQTYTSHAPSTADQPELYITRQPELCITKPQHKTRNKQLHGTMFMKSHTSSSKPLPRGMELWPVGSHGCVAVWSWGACSIVMSLLKIPFVKPKREKKRWWYRSWNGTIWSPCWTLLFEHWVSAVVLYWSSTLLRPFKNRRTKSNPHLNHIESGVCFDTRLLNSPYYWKRLRYRWFWHRGPISSFI